MRTASRLLRSLDDVDTTALNATQLATLMLLQLLNPETIRRRSQRFERWFENRPIRSPTTWSAVRSLVLALRTGCLLNTLHTDPEIAGRCMQMSDADFEDVAPTELMIDEYGCPDFRPRGLRRQERRRTRLSKLPADWLERSLRATRRSSHELRLGMLALALTGCRPCEVASLRCSSNVSGLMIHLVSAKSSRAEPGKPPRYRSFQFVRVGEMGHWVAEFEQLMALEPALHSLASVSAKALENLCRRISASEFRKLKVCLTPSCYRNLFAADLKRSGCSPEQLAYFLGHESTETATRYGVAGQGKKGRRNCLLQLDQCAPYESVTHQPRPAYA